MNLVEAHGMFAARADGGESVLPEDAEISAEDGLDPTSALATAAVSLSGALDDCSSDADLDEAAAHFRSLLASGVVTPDQWSDEALNVIAAVIEWGDCQTAGMGEWN